MSNLLLTPANWQDYFSSDQPPGQWDGEAYTYNFMNSPNLDQMGLLYMGSPAVDGDTVAFTATFSDDPAPFDGDPFYLNVVDQAGSVLLHSYGPFTGTDEPTISYDVSFGQIPALFACASASDTVPGISYVGQMRIFPTASDLVAPDETIVTTVNIPGQVTPVITQNGSPVTPDSLSVGVATYGIPSVDGLTLVYTPDEGFVGNDSFQYKATLGGVDSNMATVSVTVNAPVVAPCKELGRTTKTYVTGYSLSRVNVSRVRRMAKRCVVANFNGALDPSRSIVSVRWETTSPWAIFMANARIASNGRETMVDVTFNFSGWGGLLATATLDNGEVYNAEFSFTVLDTPLYPSATYPIGQGPFRLDATA